MHPILVIAQREFLQRIRQKSFWILLLLGPVFFMFAMIVPIGLTMNKESANQVLYLDESGLLDSFLYSDLNITFVKTNGTLESCKLKAKDYDGLLWIKKDNLGWQSNFYQQGTFGMKDPNLLKFILKQRIDEYELSSRSSIELPSLAFSTSTLTQSENGETTELIGFVIGLFGALLIIVFINQYSNMVLRGIVEEKQNRISELILTSIKPIYFITGKIVGIASVAFLQMFVWFTLAGFGSLSVQSWFQLERFSNAQITETLHSTHDISQSLEINAILNAFSSLDIGLLVLGFFYYFVFGYLLYSALFAIVGVSVGNEADAQQMAMPFTLPLAIPVMLLQFITENPDSNLVLFLTFFPFTSPTTMLLRMPMGVPVGELVLSMLTLFLTFIFAAYVASKVYRTGVLMYGKKISLKEIMRWSRSN